MGGIISVLVEALKFYS